MTTTGSEPTAATAGDTHRRHVVRRILAVLSVMTVLATTLSGVGWATLNKLSGNIQTKDVTAELGQRPVKATSAAQGDYQAVNILVMGTDTRTGQGTGYGNANDTASGNGHSDTTILFHISADRQHALAVSIPRDSIVTRPECKGSGTTTGRINTAFAEGGAGCAIKAVEHLTGVFIDHYVVVDFNGFKAVVNALGGVEVCLTTAVDDPKSHLKLSAGSHLLNGDDALKFARVRHGIGDGSDISRIGRQQDFLSSIIRAATNKGLLLNPTKLYSVLSAVTDSLTTDPQLGTFDLQQTLATSLASIPTSNITFVTVPWTLNSDRSTVSWNTAEADKIWSAMKNDTVYGKPAAATAPAGQKALTVAPSAIRVKVLNGTGTAGEAKKAATALTAAGFVVVGTGNAPSTVTSSSIVAPAGYDESLRTLAYATSVTSTSLTGTGRTLTLTIGPGWTGTLAAVTIPKPSTSSSAPAVKTADQAVCSS
jgi:LCP family protein required for cell wall assembly